MAYAKPALLIVLGVLLASLGACATGDRTGPPNLAAGSWRMSELPGFTLSPDASPTMTVHEDGRVSGSGGVNRYSTRLGGPEERPTAMFHHIAATKMAGDADRMAVEQAFFEALSRADDAVVRNGTLELKSEGRTIATFRQSRE